MRKFLFCISVLLEFGFYHVSVVKSGFTRSHISVLPEFGFNKAKYEKMWKGRVFHGSMFRGFCVHCCLKLK